MCHSPCSEHVPATAASPILIGYSAHHLANAEGKTGTAGCDVDGGKTERALEAGELETEVRRGESGRNDGEGSLPGTKGH